MTKNLIKEERRRGGNEKEKHDSKSKLKKSETKYIKEEFRMKQKNVLISILADDKAIEDHVYIPAQDLDPFFLRDGQDEEEESATMEQFVLKMVI